MLFSGNQNHREFRSTDPSCVEVVDFSSSTFGESCEESAETGVVPPIQPYTFTIDLADLSVLSKFRMGLTRVISANEMGLSGNSSQSCHGGNAPYLEPCRRKLKAGQLCFQMIPSQVLSRPSSHAAPFTWSCFFHLLANSNTLSFFPLEGNPSHHLNVSQWA